MMILKVTQGQRKSILNTFRAVSAVLNVYKLEICLRFPKMKHTIHSIIMILSVYQKHTLINQYYQEIESLNLSDTTSSERIM